MSWTKNEIDEMNNFDYGALFNQELEDITPIAEVKKEEKLNDYKVKVNQREAMRHTLARLEQMMAQERGETISYRDAYNK